MREAYHYTSEWFFLWPQQHSDILNAVLGQTRSVRDRTHGEIHLLIIEQFYKTCIGVWYTMYMSTTFIPTCAITVVDNYVHPFISDRITRMLITQDMFCMHQKKNVAAAHKWAVFFDKPPEQQTAILLRTCLWRVELERALNAGTGAGQHDTRVALEALSAAVDERDHGALLRLALSVVLQQVDQHAVDPASS